MGLPAGKESGGVVSPLTLNRILDGDPGANHHRGRSEGKTEREGKTVWGFVTSSTYFAPTRVPHSGLSPLCILRLKL